VYRIVAGAMAAPPPGGAAMPVPRGPQLIVLGLALASMLLGFLPIYALGLVQVGQPGP
jgi:hypothetical protein